MSNRSHPLYAKWKSMNARCNNPRGKSYKNYGGRGIRVCERWSGPYGFQNFASDMGLPPSPVHTLERINNDGNYEPGNCRWATRKEQALNKRDNVYVTRNGRRMTVAEWAVETGINRHTLAQRVRHRWKTEEIFSHSTNVNRLLVDDALRAKILALRKDGKLLMEIVEETGISRSHVSRVCHGWKPSQVW